MTAQVPLSELNNRSRDVFRLVVEAYLQNGEPIGSRTLSQKIDEKLSPATIRNVLQDLEEWGLLDSPHVSAGRIPTQSGLRLFVDGLLEVNDLPAPERQRIKEKIDGEDGIDSVLDRTGRVLSDLTKGASLVIVPKTDAPITHVEFVSLSPNQTLVVLVLADGTVENRLFVPPPGMTPSAMREAANFLNAALEGRKISEISTVISEQINKRRQEIDILSKQLIDSGVAQWGDINGGNDRLIVRGQSHLLDGGPQEEELELVRSLFDDLERKESLSQLLDLTSRGEGVRVFIGSENKLFSLSGSSFVVSPYMNADRKVIGAVGVIGPTRLNYGRVVPIVDFTAQMVGRIVSDL